MSKEELYIEYLKFSKKVDKLPNEYNRLKKIVLDICQILGFGKPDDNVLALFERHLTKWKKDMETYEAINNCFGNR